MLASSTGSAIGICTPFTNVLITNHACNERTEWQRESGMNDASHTDNGITFPAATDPPFIPFVRMIVIFINTLDVTAINAHSSDTSSHMINEHQDFR